MKLRKIVICLLLVAAFSIFYNLNIEKHYVDVQPKQLYATQIDVKKIDNAKDMAYELGLGINIGNTLGYWQDGMSQKAYGKTWNPLPTQEFYMALHEAGFDSVRLAVNWYKFTADPANENYTISSSYLQIIRNQIEMAINAKLYVIINIHSETGHKGQPGNQCALAGVPGGECMVDATTERHEISKKYLHDIWTQVAQAYADIDERLLFEGFNEILGTSGWADSANQLSNEEAANTNALNQEFIDAVRAQSGYNKTRFLLCNTYSTKMFVISKFVTPKTNGVTDNRVLVGIHNYDVSKITGGDATSSAVLAKPSIYGEFWTGYSPEYMITACNAVSNGTADSTQTAACNKSHVDTYIKKFLDNKVAVFIWDDGGNAHSLVNRKATSFDNIWQSITNFNTLPLGTKIMNTRALYTDLSVGTETEIPDEQTPTEPESYKLLEGANQTFEKTNEKNLTFRFDVEYSKFVTGGKVYVDDKLVDSNNYTSSSGSTIVTLKSSYLENLSNGTHTLKVEFNDNKSVTTEFTVNGTFDNKESKKKDNVKNPQTGVKNYVIGSLVLILIIIGILVYIKKTNIDPFKTSI